VKKSMQIITLLILLTAIVSPFNSCTSSPVVPSPSPPQSQTPVLNDPSEAQAARSPLLADMSQVVVKIRPSVVAIDIEATAYDFFNQPQTVQGAGSGWIIDADGYIVTNNHVVEGADTVTITLNDGRVFPAEMVRTDALTDLAVVKINADNLMAAPTGDTTRLEIADWVVAIGNSLGMGISATVGVVSALDVSLQESPGQTLHGLIQTDAAINPGNSGGPLVNTSGEVIGINSIKVSQVGVEGMGYAIAINEAMPIIQKLIEVGYVVRPWLGINAVTMNEVISARYNLAVDKGVLLTDIVSGGPADQAGLGIGDIITAINDKEIDNIGDLVDTVNSYDIGQTIDITYWHADKQTTTSLVLTESPKPQ
jgi:serine protease Do